MIDSNGSAQSGSPKSGALAGTRVVDLTRALAGPLCTQMLADHGAEVIKIEPPAGDEARWLGPPFAAGSAAYYHGLNRNKQAIALDLGKREAREVLLRLLEGADVLVENFLPGTMEKWSLGYDEALAQRFPRLVYCRISGFGSGGPLGGLPGYDAVLQAFCGLMSVNGAPEAGATRIGIPVVDHATGLSAASGILLALAERARSGRGQVVDASLFDTALSLLHPHAANWFVSGRAPVLTGSAHPNVAPYDKFATAGGEIFLGVANDGQFRKLCGLIARPELADDARFAQNAARVVHQDALRRELESAFAPMDAGGLCAGLMAAGVPAAPVNSIPQALEHPHTAARGMRVAMGEYQGLGVHVKLSRTPGSVRVPPPAFGADTRSVLAKAGYSAREIEGLIASGAVHERPAAGR